MAVRRQAAKSVKCLIAGIIIGIVAGTAVMVCIISYRMDGYYEEVRKLGNIIDDKDIRLKMLEESTNKKKFILKDIEVFFIYDGDEIDKITLEKHVKGKYNYLLGKEVNSIDINMAAEVIDKRIFKIEEREYRLKVTRLLLAETLRIWIEINMGD